MSGTNVPQGRPEGCFWSAVHLAYRADMTAQDSGSAVDAEPPLRVTFKPRTTARTVVGIGVALSLISAVIGSVAAYQHRDSASVGIAATLWALTGIVWAVHSGTSVTRMSVRGGHLVVLWRGSRLTFDLSSPLTPVEVHGTPGRSSWKVVFRRGDMDPFVIDHTMVDGVEFMRVLRYYRSSLS